MENPFLLCGLGRVGWRVLEYLRAAGLPVVVIDCNCAPGDPRLQGVRLVKGDCRKPEVLEEAGVISTRGVLILTSDDLINISTALTIRHLHPDVRIVIRMFNQNLISRLGGAVRNVFAQSTSTLVGPLLALTALTGHALGTFRIQGLDEGRRQIAGLTVRQHSPLRGRTLAEIGIRYDALVLAHLTAGGIERYLLEVRPDARVVAGDHLIVCGDPHKLVPLLEQVDHETATRVLWAGWMRRNGRMIWRTLSEVDLPVKVATGVLLCVILLSTLVFRFGTTKYSVPKAFFRSVSIMATGAEMHPFMRGGADDPEFEPWPEWMEVFAGILRIAGAALTAAFTALLTNYLLRARLFGALEVRRIPDSGHVIVCGLGNVGFRVVEELVQSRERVVVVERAADSRFVATARRLGVAVIIGDARVREVLRQAHTATARAVIAATSDDLVNLEVALIVRELAPQMRVVLRLWDTHLAETLREAADVRLALSVPALAAPAFVAALLGDWVQSVFLAGGRMLAAVDVTVGPADVYLKGHSVRSLCTDYRLLPAALLGKDRVPRTPILEQELQEGDRLTAIAALPDLERLLHREATTRDFEAEKLVAS
jgi:Trk K+ transport system NAD-binding subunit